MYWPTWLTWYKKPEYRNIKEYSDAIRSGKREYSPDRSGCVIPNKLRLDRVLGNKTCMCKTNSSIKKHTSDTKRILQVAPCPCLTFTCT